MSEIALTKIQVEQLCDTSHALNDADFRTYLRARAEARLCHEEALELVTTIAVEDLDTNLLIDTLTRGATVEDLITAATVSDKLAPLSKFTTAAGDVSPMTFYLECRVRGLRHKRALAEIIVPTTYSIFSVET